MHAHSGSWNIRSLRMLVLAGLIGSSVALSASAQPGRARALSAEDQTQVTTAKIAAIAADLSLDTAKTAQLAETVSAFEANEAKNPAKRPERGDWEATRKAQEDRVATLETSLKTFLDAPQAAQAASLLAGQSRNWDHLTLTVLSFGLEAPKEAEALAHTLAYVKDSQGAPRGRGNREDFEAMRAKMMEAKKTLDANMAPLLTEEQQATWAAKTDRGPREGGRRGGGRGDERRRGRDRSE